MVKKIAISDEAYFTLKEFQLQQEKDQKRKIPLIKIKNFMITPSVLPSKKLKRSFDYDRIF